MPIIKLTHTYTTYTKKTSCLGFLLDFKYVRHWDTLPTYHDTNNCRFFSASTEIEGKMVDGSVFNGDFVKETPEEIIRLIKEAENAR